MAGWLAGWLDGWMAGWPTVIIMLLSPAGAWAWAELGNTFLTILDYLIFVSARPTFPFEPFL